MRNQPTMLDDLILCHQRDLLMDRRGRALARAYMLGARDRDVTDPIRYRARRYRILQAVGSAVPFRAFRGPAHGISFGRDLVGDGPVAQRLVEFAKHFIGVAQTGEGKSNLLCSLILQAFAVRPAIGVMAVEMHKRELRHLLPLARATGRELIVLPWQRWQTNLLQPVGDGRAYASMIVGLLMRALGLPSRARTILAWAVDHLYSQSGLYKAGPGAFPTLLDLFELIRAAPSLNPMARDAVLDRLGSLITMLGLSAASCRRGWTPVDLEHRCLILEMGSAPDLVKDVLLHHVVYTILNDRIRRGAVNASLSWLCLIDDAQRFLSARDDDTGQSRPLEDLVGVVRSTGAGLGFFVQHLRGVPHGIMANCATKLMGRLGTGQDARELADHMMLSPDQLDWARANLGRGRFILSPSAPEWRFPAAVETPHVRIAPVVTAEDVEASLAPLLSVPVEHASGFESWSMHRGVPAARLESALDEAAKRYLRAVLDSPGLPSSKYPPLARLSPRRALEVRDRLVRMGQIRLHEVQLSTTGRAAIVVEPVRQDVTTLPIAPGTSG